MTLECDNPLFGPQNGPKCIISSIMVHNLHQDHVNHILMHFCTLLGHFDTNSEQYYQNTMTIGPENPLYGLQN